jgi:zinc protease
LRLATKLFAVLAAVPLLPASPTASQSIPAHPRELRYPERSIALPSADGRRVELGEGIVVYFAPDRSLPLVEISLAIPVGSFLDPPTQAGVSLLTGGQIRRGGAGDLAADEFDNRVDDLGARITTMAGTTRSGASLSVPEWTLEEGLDLFFSMLSRPRFQPDRLAAAQGNLIEGMSRRNENAIAVLEREWNWLMYGESHFSTRPLTPASIGSIGRDDLFDFHRRYWCPTQIILAVSGDFDRDSILPALQERLDAWTASRGTPEAVQWRPPSPSTRAKPGLYHYEMNVPQAKVIIGHRLPELPAWTAPDRFLLEVVGELLGGRGAVSRIAGRLRTSEGLVYRASARLDPGELWAGELQIFFDTHNSSVSRAIELVVEEVERVRSQAAHPDELAAVKQSLLSRLQLRFDTAEEIAGYFAEDELLDRPHTYWQSYLDVVSSVTPAEVQRAAADTINPSSFTYLTVGRWAEISAAAPPGSSTLEGVTGHRVIHLQRRDPLTLEPMVREEEGATPDADRSDDEFPR